MLCFNYDYLFNQFIFKCLLFFSIIYRAFFKDPNADDQQLGIKEAPAFALFLQ